MNEGNKIRSSKPAHHTQGFPAKAGVDILYSLNWKEGKQLKTTDGLVLWEFFCISEMELSWLWN